jgi:prevent-host-death family protein
MREVGVLQAKTQLSALLDLVETEGEEIVITRHGRPVARLTRAAAAGGQQRRLSGTELVSRFKALQDRIARENPQSARLSKAEVLGMREP